MENHTLKSDLIPDYNIFIKPDIYSMTEKQYQTYKEFCENINYFRANPIEFIRTIIGAELLDYQIYAIEGMLRASQSVIVMSRNGGKSTVAALFIMYMLCCYCNYNIAIVTSSGSQSIETFEKVESIVKRTIPSFKTLTTIYSGELKGNNTAKGDGFVHNVSSYTMTLNNGSKLFTCNSNLESERGKRAQMILFDEAGSIPSNYFPIFEPYTAQDSDFGLGVGMDNNKQGAMTPPNIQNKRIYIGSASSVDSWFFAKYKETWLHQMAGDPDYFCMDLPCDGVINATSHGEKLNKPLLSRSTVDQALSTDKLKAMKEYMDLFDSEGGTNCIFTRSSLIKVSKPYLPEFRNIDNQSFYGLFYDPARRQDNSCCLIAKFYQDPIIGWKARIVNCVILIDLQTKDKTMLSAPEQVRQIKKLLLSYNGTECADYEHIVCLDVDAGSGGSGVNLTDFLCSEWEDGGIIHKGLIDPEYNPEDKKRFPDAVPDKLHLIKPSIKPEMYEAAIQMVSQECVEFPEEYDSHGYITLLYDVDKNGNKTPRYIYPTDKEERDLHKLGITVEAVRHDLDQEEETALLQINMLKTELVNIWRYKQSNGSSRFDLAPDKANILHDDRAYCFVLLCKYLSDLRREKITNKKPVYGNDELLNDLPIHTGVRQTMF